VRYMSGKGPLNNEWLGIKAGTIGPEYGIGHAVGNTLDAPVMILKCCIGNRSLGWDLLPPGSERFEEAARCMPVTRIPRTRDPRAPSPSRSAGMPSGLQRAARSRPQEIGFVHEKEEVTSFPIAGFRSIRGPRKRACPGRVPECAGPFIPMAPQ